MGGHVLVSITAVKHINAKGRGLGEISGPALAVTFRMLNRSSRTLSLNSVTANLTDDAGDPAVVMAGPPAQPFRGNLAAGKARSAVYVFAVAKDHRTPVTISFSYTTQAPVVLFRGDAA